MSHVTLAAPAEETMAELVERLGSIPLNRIRRFPPPGAATEEDVLAVHRATRRLCELVEGVLVEKPMGFYESRLAIVLGAILEEYVNAHDLGIVLGADGMMRLAPGLVRIPDVSFLSWDHFPNKELPAEPIPNLAPDLAVEVLSTGNTETEMERKRLEYFEAGVRLVWVLDPTTRTAEVYTPDGRQEMVRASESLKGGDILPGFVMSLSEWFARAGKRRQG